MEIRVPPLPESVTDATVAAWHKKPGEPVRQDEKLVDLETDKVVLEVPAPADGVLKDIRHPEGDTVTSGEVLAVLEPGEVAGVAPEEKKMPTGTPQPPPSPTPAAEPSEPAVSPSVRRLLTEHGLSPEQIPATGKGGRLTREDVLAYLERHRPAAPPTGERPEQRVPMTRIRARIAQRLLEVQRNTAMLTTFNEVDLDQVIRLRKRHGEAFQKKHGVKLGFMSFFVKAAVAALKAFPIVNASIDGEDIVYHGYFDIGIAVSTDRGLVVPILRDADRLDFAEIEKRIEAFAHKAREGTLALEDLQGGTFTITNGGIFGSLLSTPLLNPPQSAILGMHAIKERPVAVDGQVVIRPMMYLALTYDHRLIDGREAVLFLRTIKEILEAPERLFLEI